jgi:hypothetical protein
MTLAVRLAKGIISCPSVQLAGEFQVRGPGLATYMAPLGHGLTAPLTATDKAVPPPPKRPSDPEKRAEWEAANAAAARARQLLGLTGPQALVGVGWFWSTRMGGCPWLVSGPHTVRTIALWPAHCANHSHKLIAWPYVPTGLPFLPAPPSPPCLIGPCMQCSLAVSVPIPQAVAALFSGPCALLDPPRPVSICELCRLANVLGPSPLWGPLVGQLNKALQVGRGAEGIIEACHDLQMRGRGV